MKWSWKVFRWVFYGYCLFDWFIGGSTGGFLPMTTLAAAQFTQVTGTVVDPNGLPYANGTITPLLVSSATPTLNGLAYTPPTQASGLDNNGHFILQLGDNTALLPAGSQWNFTVCSGAGTILPAGGKGSVCFSLASPITISGTVQDISIQLNQRAVSLGSTLAITSSPGSPSTPVYLGAVWQNWTTPPTGAPNYSTMCTGNPPITNNGGTGTANYCAFLFYVLPYIDFIGVHIQWATGQTQDGLDTGFETSNQLTNFTATIPTNPPAASQYTFTNFDLVFGSLAQFTCARALGRPHPCWVIGIMGPSGNNNTPKYVFTSANQQTPSWSQVSAPVWTTGTKYFSGQVVCFPGGAACANGTGTYYHVTTSTTPWFCTSTGSTGPTGDGGCPWTNDGTHPPPHDVAACTAFPGTNLPSNATTNVDTSNCTGATQCTLGQLQTGINANWETPLSVAFQNAVNALTTHIAGTFYASQFKYLRLGGTRGGEWQQNCEPQLTGLMPGASTTQYELSYTNYATNFFVTATANKSSGLPLDVSFAGPNNTYSDNMALIGQLAGVGIGWQGLQLSDVLNFTLGQSCSNDSCAIFQRNSGLVPFYHAQPQFESVQNNTGTGSITSLVPFMIKQRYQTTLYLEIFTQDALWAFFPGYTDANACCGNVAPWGPYFQVFSSMTPLMDVPQLAPPIVEYNTPSVTAPPAIGNTNMVNGGGGSVTGTHSYSLVATLTQTVLGSACVGNTTGAMQVVYTDATGASATQTLTFQPLGGTPTNQFTVATNGTVGALGTFSLTNFTATTTLNSNPIQYKLSYNIGGSCAPGPTVQLTNILLTQLN